MWPELDEVGKTEGEGVCEGSEVPLADIAIAAADVSSGAEELEVSSIASSGALVDVARTVDTDIEVDMDNIADVEIEEGWTIPTLGATTDEGTGVDAAMGVTVSTEIAVVGALEGSCGERDVRCG